ncbi:hypothetical protein C453_18300 [Haloferax elongans ATCC BAA-1513]|uniref:Uncharacterized protein n=1 Tax=Haloferax elongans ATCC BAA-1513 TaxID=1230453 RepID=M0H8W5_HALEO|nr:hypothetical protein [Haloferax elongans]ELZ80915.1 hypothetical protein C453_18300 [Haloferax elongans ATCC BAA-1513]
MASDSSNESRFSVLKRLRPKRTRLRVSACVAASRSIEISDDDA